MKKKNLHFEKFNKLTDIQKMSIAFFVGLFVMLGCITLYRTFAIYKEEKTFEVIEGTIPNFTKKDKDLEIAIMVDGTSSSEVPTESHDYRVRVECDTEEISGTWNYTNWNAHIEGNITMPATCTIIFESIYDSIIVDGEEKDNIPDKGDYQYNLTCENVTSSTFDEETWNPIVTGVKENSSCSIVFKSTNSIITKIIDANGQEVQNYPTKEETGSVKITCTNGSTGEWDKENWKPIIKNIANETTCEVAFSSKVNIYDSASIGDYVAYTPNSTSYDIPYQQTGACYSRKQTINPSELNLWRVIRKNNDKSVDIIAEYASSNTVIIEGEDGYQNLIGTLNTIAGSYETEGITLGSRHIGYSNQIEKCSSISSKNCDSDTGYETDVDLVKSAIGTLVTYKVKTNTATEYWLASRFKQVDTGGATYYNNRYIDDSGKVVSGTNYCRDYTRGCNGGGHGCTSLYIYVPQSQSTTGNPYSSDTGFSFAIRPIVTLKSGLTAKEGNKNSKKLWTIEQ